MSATFFCFYSLFGGYQGAKPHDADRQRPGLSLRRLTREEKVCTSLKFYSRSIDEFDWFLPDSAPAVRGSVTGALWLAWTASLLLITSEVCLMGETYETHLNTAATRMVAGFERV